MALSKPQSFVANFSGGLGNPHVYANHNEVQRTMDGYAASGSDYEMTTVALSPQEGTYYDSHLDLPLTVPTGVHLDLNGMTIRTAKDTDIIHLQPGSALTKGHLNWTPAGDGYSSSVIKLDDSTWDRDATATDPILIRDVWGRGQPTSSGIGVFVTLQNGYSVDGGLLVKHQRFYRVGQNHFRVEVGDSESSFDNNTFKECFNHSGHPILINFHSQVSGATINNNKISGVFHPSNYSNNPDSNWLAKLHGYAVKGNHFFLTPMWDLHRFDDGLFWFEEDQYEGVINNHMYNTQQIPPDERGWIDHNVETWYDRTSHKQNAHTIWNKNESGPGRGALQYGNYQN
jgi:hypothetical protein